jgi:hypothetical protein
MLPLPTLISAEEYARLGAVYARHIAWLGDRRSYKPEECPVDCRITNEERSLIEVYEFYRDKPQSYFAYVTGGMSYIMTWAGDRLGRITSRSCRNRQGRVSIVVMGDNGVRYYGTHYSTTGDYCNLRAYKRS